MSFDKETAVARLHDLVNVYAIDLPDATATEVLLVVDEILDILGLDVHQRHAFLGPRVVAHLEHWDTDLGPTHGSTLGGLAPWTRQSIAATSGRAYSRYNAFVRN